MPERIAVVGIAGGPSPGVEVRRLVETADVVVGGRHHLDAFAPGARRRVVLAGDVAGVLDEIDATEGTVCVLASGDPGFFGIVRPLAERFGRGALEVHPAPSSVALAFARLGLPWDDAIVVSAHGRSLDAAADRVCAARKAAVLVSPDNPPEALGRALLGRGAAHDRVFVCSRLGEPSEEVADTDLPGLATGTWDWRSVVVLLAGTGVGPRSLAWGRPEAAFAHRDGMITKAEVRAVVLGKLDLPAAGVLWDVGAGSGSVAVECAALAPGLDVHAIERDRDDAANVRANARSLGVRVAVHEGHAPEALRGLPDPDRVFVGGGGLDVLDAVASRVLPGGMIVATYAALDRAAAAAARLGSLVQVSVSRGERLPDGSFRLVACNPVFVVWGAPR